MPAILSWIDAQQERMLRLVRQWSAINSHTGNVAGVTRMVAAARSAFAPLGGTQRLVRLPAYESIGNDGATRLTPVGPALSIRKRPRARRSVLLCIHTDTVYPPANPAAAPKRATQKRNAAETTQLKGNILRGPGVADAKGGLVVMLVALQALEKSDAAEKLGWEVLLNPDEEIGSSSSRSLLEQAAGRHQVGLLFEPALDDAGTLAAARRGTGNFAIVVRGRSAHAGRDFAAGRNALAAAAELAVGLHQLNRQLADITINVARLDGGGPLNVVPNLAILRFNVRITQPDQAQPVQRCINDLVAQINQHDGISAELIGRFGNMPKLFDQPHIELFNLVAQCARDLGRPVRWHDTGGVCDGNRLAAAGLPNVDSLGVCGGGLHSADEYMLVDSLTQRAKLAAVVLMRLASEASPLCGGEKTGTLRVTR
ncbi:MAG: hydrolase [Phycisphaeraceae bacterium]